LTLTVRIKPRARREILALAAWCVSNRTAARAAVETDLQEALELLAVFPGIGTRVENARDAQTRRWLLGRLGHFLYYRQRGNTLEVLACWSTSRESEPKV
jgi:plasmid stabilization system protein ParE